MRAIIAILIVTALAVVSCNRKTEPVPTSGSSEITIVGPPPREVTPSEATTPEKKSTPISSGIFKPIPQRSTEDLIAEVEHPNTKDRLPLLAELATRTKDKDRILPVANRLMLDGRYSVRVLAAMVRIAVDPEHLSKHATDLNVALSGKNQMPVYGPIQEVTPELRTAQKLVVPNLVKAIEADLDEKKLYPQTGGALSILSTLPAEIGKPATDVVKRTAATPMHPNATQASELLKKWEAK